MPARWSDKLTPRQRQMAYAWRRAAGLIGLAVVIVVAIVADRAGVFGRRPVADSPKYHEQAVTCVKVVDGDTIDVDLPDGQFDTTRIRLWGVDTPETVKEDTPVQHFGPEATALTKQLTLGRPVTIRLEPNEKPRDRHGRLLAYVILPDGRMLNRVLVETGHAYADPRYRHRLRREFLRLQRQAMADRVGLWKDVTANDLPYYWQGKLRLPAEQ
ncbi:MAG: thermonuclease family protein [Planctomycetota bacterium]|jgi:endonuclease YncB( thermonuclease family)